jgi:hypothetical protein
VGNHNVKPEKRKPESEIMLTDNYNQDSMINTGKETKTILLSKEVADRYFLGTSQLVNRMDAVLAAIQNEKMFVVPASKQQLNIIVNLTGIVPNNK